MTIEPQWLIVAGAAVLFGGLALLNRARERNRRDAYEEYSLVRGFRFEPERPEGERPFRDMFQQFNQGRRRRWGYTISGTKNGAPFTAFEYQWVTGGGKNSSTNQITGILWEQDGGAIPAFALSPEGWVSRVGELFGAQDIDFQESPDFSKAYRLQGADETSIRALFNPELRRFFEATPGQNVGGSGRFLFWWRGRRLPAVDELDEWLELGDQVRRRFFKR